MKPDIDLLGHAIELFPPPGEALARVERRRSVRQRNRRIRAGLVGAALAVILVVGLARALRSDPVPAPVETPTIDPVLSPVGADMYVVDPSTGEARKLLTAEGDQWGPERSPDGSRIAYTNLVEGAVPQVYVLEPDGAPHQITFFDHGAQDPSWSPDGTQLTFASRGRDGDIYVVDANGGTPRRLGGTPRADYAPDWSPDGQTIVFDTTYPNDVYALSVPDGALTRLTFTDNSYSPSWSPDGRWIAFTQYRKVPGQSSMNDDVDLWLVRPDGSHTHRLADTGRYEEGLPAWSPDGRSIVIEGPDPPLLVVDVDTGTSRVLDTSAWGGPGFPLGDESWRWIGSTSAMTWDTTGILRSYDEWRGA